ncbi:MAG: site-2 protease family protein, partial [Planctomycetota bacterium]|nr:site-2 protease family protein [Planctomycetota bacterium]
AVDGVSVSTYAELIASLSNKVAMPVSVSVQRQNKSLPISVPSQPRRETGLVMVPGPIASVQADSPASEVGLKAGDKIVSIDGESLGNPLTIDNRLRKRSGEVVLLGVLRTDAVHNASGELVPETIEITPRDVTWIEQARWPQSPVAVSSLGIAFNVGSEVAKVVPDSPAARAGIQDGEFVTRARFAKKDEPIDENDPGVELSEESQSWPFVMAMIQQSPKDTRLQLTVKSSDGLARDVELNPVDSTVDFIVDRGLVFRPVYRLVKAGSIGAALTKGLSKTGEDLSMVYRFLQKITSNQISPRLLGGPIEIAKQAGKSAEEGLGRLLLFLTMLSANLAVINFLPIPVLDGGHMVFLMYELVRGKPPSENVVAALSYIGLILLLSLMLFVFGLDLGLIARR